MELHQFVEWLDNRLLDPIVQQQICEMRLNSPRCQHGELTFYSCPSDVMDFAGAWIESMRTAFVLAGGKLNTKYMQGVFPVCVDARHGNSTIEISFDTIDTKELVYAARLDETGH